MPEVLDQKNHKKRLGRGLGSLLSENTHVEEKPVEAPPAAAVQVLEVQPKSFVDDENRIWQIPIEKVIAHREQPRKHFEASKLAELTASIKEKGILQPIVARKKGEQFEIIAGERRWRAAQAAGLHQIPVIIKKSDDQETLELALIENIQRHDLNPVEESKAYYQLAEKYRLNHQEIADRVGKDRATVTNSLRLLALPARVLEYVSDGRLSVGHAKVILGIPSSSKQAELAERAISQKLSVRKLEKLVIESGETLTKAAQAPQNHSSDQKVKTLQDELQKLIGTKIEIEYRQGKGRITLQYYSDDQLNQIVDSMRSGWRKSST